MCARLMSHGRVPTRATMFVAEMALRVAGRQEARRVLAGRRGPPVTCLFTRFDFLFYLTQKFPWHCHNQNQSLVTFPFMTWCGGKAG
jgi:hypothetical protein